MKFSFPVRLRHWFIISRWQKWLFLVCCILHVAILGWLLLRGLFWVACAFGTSPYGSRARRSLSGWPVKNSELGCLVVRFREELIDSCSSFPHSWTLAGLSAGSSRDVLAKFWLAAPGPTPKPLVVSRW